MIGIVTGLAAEAAIAARLDGVRVVCAGSQPGRAEALADGLAGDGLRGLISFGVAGGLADDLPSGTVIVADAVVAGDERLEADDAWAADLARRIRARRGVVAGSPVIVGNPAGKQALRARSGALIVDMETIAVARAARRAGVPWTAIRAVADPAGLALPPAALVALGDDGRPDLVAVLAAIARRPRQVPDLIRLAGATRAALRGLLRGVDCLGGAVVGGAGIL